MNTELVVDLLKPFECLEHLLTALYILTEYSSYQVNILNSLIIRATRTETPHQCDPQAIQHRY